MKTNILVLIVLLLTPSVFAQKLISKNGHIRFYSHTPLEDIEADNNQVVSILDPSTGTIQFSLLVKSFEFKRALMQEHFNENYMESDKIPKAGFTGKITNLDKINLKKNGTYPAEVTGDLSIHGVTKSFSTSGTITVDRNSVRAVTKFSLVPKDFNIEIPSVVENKIAKEIEVNVDVTYSSD